MLSGAAAGRGVEAPPDGRVIPTERRSREWRERPFGAVAAVEARPGTLAALASRDPSTPALRAFAQDTTARSTAYCRTQRTNSPRLGRLPYIRIPTR